MFFSIIIPVYNRPEKIINALNSILIQTFTDYEIIIVNDASTDNTKDVIEDFYKNKKEKYIIKIINLNVNKGVNYAKNIGIKNSFGKYMIFLDSDDTFLTENSLFEIYEEIFQTQNPGILMFKCETKSTKSIIKRYKKYGIITYSEYLSRTVVGEFMPVVKSDIIKNILFEENIRGGEHITWNKITKYCGSLYLSNLAVRYYDDISTDRLSIKNDVFFERMISIYIQDIRVNSYEYYKHTKLVLFRTLSLIMYYLIKLCLYKIKKNKFLCPEIKI